MATQHCALPGQLQRSNMSLIVHVQRSTLINGQEHVLLTRYAFQWPDGENIEIRLHRKIHDMIQ